jgi:hypothetical protein
MTAKRIHFEVQNLFVEKGREKQSIVSCGRMLLALP